MQVLRKRITVAQKRMNTKWSTIELDYALSWVLAAISEHQLGRDLIFKGGTCLKKCYFGQYRFSEDLDFTLISEISDPDLDAHLDGIIRKANALFSQQAEKLGFFIEPYAVKGPHPGRQRAYTVRVQFPWHREPLTRIKLEISREELLTYAPQQKKVIHEYGEILDHPLACYALEEILAEKYRAILQNQAKLKEKSWIRSRVRDFYDLWQILKKYRTELVLDGFVENFKKKCAFKEIEFSGASQFFSNEKYLGIVEQDWDRYLGNLISQLPKFSILIPALEEMTKEIFEES